MTPYKLVDLTDALLDQIVERWQIHAGAEAFTVEMGTLFAEYRSDPSLARALVSTTTGEVDALLEVVSTPFGKNGATTKLLKMWISPEYWAAKSPAREKLFEIHSWAYIEVISDGMFHAHDTIKIYGRTDLMLDILRALEDVWNTKVVKAFDKPWTASMADRWLVLTKD